VHEWLEVISMSMDLHEKMNVKLTDLMNRVQFPISKQIENDQLKISRQLLYDKGSDLDISNLPCTFRG